MLDPYTSPLDSAIISCVNISRASLPRILFFCFCVLLAATPLHAQTATPTATSLTPGPKPADAPLEWKQLLGIYGKGNNSVIVLESNGQLIWHGNGGDSSIQDLGHSELVIANKYGNSSVATENRDSDGNVTMLELAPKVALPADPGSHPAHSYRLVHSLHLSRVDAGADPAHFYHITPTKPLEELRAAAFASRPPEEPGLFRKPDLVELITLDSAIHLDIRYAHNDNFLGTPLYTQARAFLQRPAAEALLRVLRKLQPLGYGLLIHDGYRPWYITRVFWDATPPEGHDFVADPKKGSKHNRGCAVDLTLYELATGKEAEMPGLYDEMSPRSYPTFPGGTSLQRWHRDLLRRAMEAEGFAVNQYEWWHFDYKDWKLYPLQNVPFEKLDTLATSSN